MHKSSRRPSAMHNGQKNWGGNREDLHKKCFLPGRFSLARRMIVLKVLNNGNAAPMLFPRLLLFASPPSTTKLSVWSAFWQKHWSRSKLRKSIKLNKYFEIYSQTSCWLNLITRSPTLKAQLGQMINTDDIYIKWRCQCIIGRNISYHRARILVLSQMGFKISSW